MKKVWMLLAAAVLLAGLLLPAAACAEGAERAYRVQGRDNNSGDHIIAKYNVADYGARGDGTTDDTKAFQAALREANATDGATVYVPPGRYRVTEQLSLRYCVTLEGNWNDPNGKAKGEESVLYADIAEGEKKHFIQSGPNCCIRNLTFYYPNQSAASPKRYGYTVNAVGHSQSLENLTFVNSWRAVNVGNRDGGSAHNLNNIHGTVLSSGIRFNEDFEVTSLTNVWFNASYWHRFDGTDKAAIRSAARESCLPVYIGKVDDHFVYNVNIDADDYARGIYMEPNPDHTDPNTPAMGYGLFFRLHGAAMDIPQDDAFLPKRYRLDEIAGLENYEHAFAADRYPENAGFYCVTDYGAKGDGLADDTPAVKAALAAAQSGGGGTVFLPSGKYRLTDCVTVPEGTEVRGEWSGLHMKSPTQILCDWGRNLPDEALFTLRENSGLHGLTFRLPGHKWEDIAPYAWAVRGAGSNVWTEYLTFINLYNGIDMAANRCDNFLIKGTWGTAVNTGIAVGGGSENGKMEFNFFTYGTWYEDIGRADNGALSTYTYANATGYRFGDVTNLEAISLCIFGLKHGMVFDEQNGGVPENVLIIRSLLDSPMAYRNLWIKRGKNLAFVGASTGNSTASGKLICVEAATDGKVRVYGQNMWGKAFNKLDPAADAAIYAEGDDAEILKFNFRYPFNKYRASGLGGWAIFGICAGCAVAAGGIAAMTILLVRRRKKSGN